MNTSHAAENGVDAAFLPGVESLFKPAYIKLGESWCDCVEFYGFE